MALKKLKIALVCDWLTNSGGAEKIILELHRLFPEAPLFTSVYNPRRVKGFENAQIHTSYLQHFPFAKRHHQFYLSFYPHVFEQFNLDAYDLVISSSHCCAKGVITKPTTLHVSYCHSPMRYAWEDSINYIQQYQTNGLVKKVAPFFLHKIRMWDRLSADRVDSFLTNSRYVQQRIHKYYRKPSTVIHPFIDVKKFTFQQQRENFYLAVGRLTAYKRFDLVVEAFNRLQLPLKIVGTGNCFHKLQKKANKNIEFLGFVPDEKLAELYARAKALVFPQVEDFGIVPLEAMASGCPVIAFSSGGALETIKEGETGVFFKAQTLESLEEAIQTFQKKKFDADLIRKHAETFDRRIFDEKMVQFLEEQWLEFNH